MIRQTRRPHDHTEWPTFMLAVTALGLQIGWWQTLGIFIALTLIDFTLWIVGNGVRRWRR